MFEPIERKPEPGEFDSEDGDRCVRCGGCCLAGQVTATIAYVTPDLQAGQKDVLVDAVVCARCGACSLDGESVASASQDLHRESIRDATRAARTHAVETLMRAMRPIISRRIDWALGGTAAFVLCLSLANEHPWGIRRVLFGLIGVGCCCVVRWARREPSDREVNAALDRLPQKPKPVAGGEESTTE